MGRLRLVRQKGKVQETWGEIDYYSLYPFKRKGRNLVWVDEGMIKS